MVAQGSLPKHLHTSDQDRVEPKRNGLDQQQADAIVQLGQALHFTIRLLLLLPGFAFNHGWVRAKTVWTEKIF